MIQKLELAEAKNSLPLTFKATIDGTSDLDESLSTLKRIVGLTDTVIKGTNVDSLLAYYGLKADNRPDAAKIKTDMDKQKANLLEAYVRKAIALGKINAIETYQNELDSAKKVTSVADDIDAIFNDAGKLIDCFDQKVKIMIRCLTNHKHLFNEFFGFFSFLFKGAHINIMARLFHATIWPNVKSIAKNE